MIAEYPLLIFLVTLHRPCAHKQPDAQERKHLMRNTIEVAATNEDIANGIKEIAHRDDTETI